ncbi:MAG: hypothetical protein VXY09_04600 [Bacteroidota bacterium]|nr:hypothetical protein [Bacteroidota bacterium]
MIIINLLTAFNLIFFNTGNFIENEFVRVETKWNLYEETKKKLIYEVSFNIINKKESEIYYSASKVKNIEKLINSNSGSEDISNENFDNARNQGNSKITTAVQAGSSYVSSGGSKTVGDQSSLSGGGAGRTDVTERKSIKKNDVKSKPAISYNVLTHFFSFNNSNPKNLKFLIMEEDEKIINLISDSQEKFSYNIPLNNLIDIEGSNIDKPLICKIPTDGLVIKSKIEISKRSNQKPEEFGLEFTKDEVYAGKIKLLIDKTFHSSIEEAITKYKELQKILNENI